MADEKAAAPAAFDNSANEKKFAALGGQLADAQKELAEVKASLAAKTSSSGTPVWLAAMLDILEEIWASMSASESEPDHAVTQKLAALKRMLSQQRA